MIPKSKCFGDAILPVCVSLIFFASIAGFVHYSIEERRLMAQNINSAIEKGVDPLSVRCSYASSDDIVCITFASSSQTIRVPDLRK